MDKSHKNIHVLHNILIYQIIVIIKSEKVSNSSNRADKPIVCVQCMSTGYRTVWIKQFAS